MVLGYAQNHTVGTYLMLNLRTKFILISRDIIWLNKAYGEYVSRKENTNSDTYILQDEENSYNWDSVKKLSCKE